jgi:hypothetical protein
LALPWLESLQAAGGSVSAGATQGLPRRTAFIYVPNGANMADWTPQDLGRDYRLPMILEPLEGVRDDVLVISGLAHDKARPNGDGAGDHARASATFLTGCQARKTSGSDIHVGVSVDQLLAEKLRGQTRFASLELGCDRGQQTGNCDSGYSCAYSFNISWRTPSSPVPPETDPRQVFERLFAGPDRAENAEAKTRRERQQKSILDFVSEDARQLRSRLGRTDQRKVEEYLAAVREIELRAAHVGALATGLPAHDKPTGVPAAYEDHIRLMFDLLALSFQTDTTRVASFIMAHDGSNRPYPFLGVSEGHHDLSHHQNDAEKKRKIAQINQFHMHQLARFLAKLKSIREGQGTLLDQCMVVYGSGIADGNSHAHHDLPVVLAGRGGGTLDTGRHVRYPKDTPMTNLYLSLMERMGAPTERMGDSSGSLAGLG